LHYTRTLNQTDKNQVLRNLVIWNRVSHKTTRGKLTAGILLNTESYHVDIRADIEVTIRLGRRRFLCFYKQLFSNPFRNSIASSIRLIMILPCTTVYHKKWSTMAYYSNTTRAGVNLYLQNGIMSCRLKTMLIPSVHTSIFTRHI